MYVALLSVCWCFPQAHVKHCVRLERQEHMLRHALLAMQAAA